MTKKLIRESLNENFEKESDPIKDMGIGLPTTHTIWEAYEDPQEIADNLTDALKEFGIHVYVDFLIYEDSGGEMYGFIFSPKELTEKEIDREEKKFNADWYDDEE